MLGKLLKNKLYTFLFKNKQTYNLINYCIIYKKPCLFLYLKFRRPILNKVGKRLR